MFYKTGVDITSDKQMFNFLKEHFEYYTMNSWNGLCSIANNVKLYNLGLSGDWYVALSLLKADDYDELNYIISDWKREHPTFKVYFNGCSGGYLILANSADNRHVLPDTITDFDDYGEYKEWCRDQFGSVKANRDELVFYTKLVQDFDKLCDQLRDYCDELSKQDFAAIEMEKIVFDFNTRYEDDLDLLGFMPLESDDGIVNISDISTFLCMKEAFLRIADRRNFGYVLKNVDDKGNVKLCEK
jgi:hypothetical protein